MGRYSPIGLDVGAGTVKVAQLTRSNGRWRPATLSRASWNALDPNEPAFDASLTQSVRLATAQAGTKGRRAVICAPTAVVDFRPITVPVSEGLDILTYVQTEVADRHAATSSQFVCDFWVAGEIVEHGETKLQVYAVSAQRDLIASLVRAVERSGLICTRVEADATAIAHAVAASTDLTGKTGQLVLDIGDLSSVLLSLGDDGVEFCRIMKWGGRQVTENIRRTLDIDMETAEQIKCEWGLRAIAPENEADCHPRQQQINDSIEQELRNLALEIGRSLAYYARHQNQTTASAIGVIGGAARLNGLDRFIRDALKLTVTRQELLPEPNTPADAQTAPNAPQTKTNGQAHDIFAAAIGAALVGAR